MNKEVAMPFDSSDLLFSYSVLTATLICYFNKKKPLPQSALTLHHTPVGCVCDGIDMRGHLMSLFAFVHLHYFFGVYGQVLVRIDYHAEQA